MFKYHSHLHFLIHQVPTIGVDILSYTLTHNPFEDRAGSEQSVRNSKIILQFWDVSHVEVCGTQRDLILSDADGVVAVTDWTESGVGALDDWRALLAGFVNPSKVPMLLLVNKKDLGLELEPELVSGYASDAGFCGWRYVSALTGEGVSEAIEGLLDRMIQARLLKSQRSAGLDACLNMFLFLLYIDLIVF